MTIDTRLLYELVIEELDEPLQGLDTLSIINFISCIIEDNPNVIFIK